MVQRLTDFEILGRLAATIARLQAVVRAAEAWRIEDDRDVRAMDPVRESVADALRREDAGEALRAALDVLQPGDCEE